MLIPELAEIKRMRAKLNLTQNALARQCGVSQSIIAKIERGRSDPAYSTVRKIFDFFERQAKVHGATAGKIMNSPLIFLSEHDSAGRAIALMQKHSISALPVLDAGKPIGHVSDDILTRAIVEGKSIPKMRVGQLMGDGLPVVEAGAPAQLVQEMLRFSKAVLVMRGRKIEGIVTKADLLKLVKV